MSRLKLSRDSGFSESKIRTISPKSARLNTLEGFLGSPGACFPGKNSEIWVPQTAVNALKLSILLSPRYFCIIFRIHRRKLGGCVWLGVSHKIFSQHFDTYIRNTLRNIQNDTFGLGSLFTDAFICTCFIHAVIDFQHIEYQYGVSASFFALRSLVTNFQSQKLHNLALVFIIRLISQKVIGVFKSRNTVLEIEHSSSCSPNGINFHGISAENKPREFAKMTQKHLPKKASFVSLGRRAVFTQKCWNLHFVLTWRLETLQHLSLCLHFSAQWTMELGNTISLTLHLNSRYKHCIIRVQSQRSVVFACFKYGNWKWGRGRDRRCGRGG